LVHVVVEGKAMLEMTAVPSMSNLAGLAELAAYLKPTA
jgi:hypothetical protein